MTDILDELRRTVPAAPRYKVTAAGHVFGPYGRQLNPHTDHNGYRRLYVYVGGDRIRLGVHQMVCEAFHGPRPGPNYVAKHLNGLVFDNRAANLEWRLSGAAARLTDDDVRAEWRARAAGVMGRLLAAEYGVDERTISRIHHRKQRETVPDDPA